MPDPSFIGSNATPGTDVQTVIVTTPTGTASLDDMFAIFSMRGTALPVTPSGWTKLTEFADGTGSTASRMSIYQRHLTAAPASTYTFDAGVSNRWAAGIMTYRDVGSVEVGPTNSSTGSTTATALGISTIDGILMACFGLRSNKSTDPSGMTSRISEATAASKLYTYDLVTSTSPTGDKTLTLPSDHWTAILIAINKVPVAAFEGWGVQA